MEDVARYKWDKARVGSHSKIHRFPQKPEKKADLAFGNEADIGSRMFLFRELPVDTQQEHIVANKEGTSNEETKTYLMRKNQYQKLITPSTRFHPFNVATYTVTITKTTAQTL